MLLISVYSSHIENKYGSGFMHIISYKKIRDFISVHADAKSPLNSWYRIVDKAAFESFNDVRNMFPSADQVKNFVVFNIGGNKYRLIAFFRYNLKRIYIRQILTHKEYDKNKWKDDPWHNSKE